VFAYYKRLSRRQQAIYRQSAAIEHMRLTDAHAFFPLTDELATAMAGEDQKVISHISSELIAELCRSLKAPMASVRVLAKRPSDDWGELHGLYEPVDRNQTARMLHELCHHLDYELFSLEESFHTEGFYKRESSLFHQIVRDSAKKTE
jgi:hypothetical protein